MLAVLGYAARDGFSVVYPRPRFDVSRITHIGVDYGTSMLKAARCDSATSVPQTLNLTDHSPFVPVAVQLQGTRRATGWEAFRQRRTALGQTAVAFRDRLSVLDSSLTLGPELADAVSVQAELFGAARVAVQQATGGAAEPLAVAVPDDWYTSHWSLPVAMARARWSPTLLVRESCAAMALLEGPPKQQVMLLSLGAGSARGTVCECQGMQWHRTACARSDRVSGQALRERLVKRVTERVVQQTRRDPREDGAADQAVHDAVDGALLDLQSQSSTAVHARIFGQDFQYPLSREDLVELARPFREPIEQLVERLYADTGINKCAIVIWGELTSLLRIDAWLARFCPSGEQATRLPLDAIAGGTARLCAWWNETQPQSSPETFGGLCPSCGQFSARLVQATCSKCRCECGSLVEQGMWGMRGAPARPRAVLILGEGVEQRKEIAGDTFRLGRNPLSEWVFEDGEVSRAHASIRWDGGNYRIIDLDSENGTYVNRRKVAEAELHDGDEIQLGRKGPCLRIEIRQD